MPKLTESELQSALSTLPGWQVEDGQLAKTFDFDSYLAGVEFARKCANHAEEVDHHPDLLITWRKVRVALSTHSEGGITEKDVESAKAYERFNS
jgi:4a-hydroxytetrahydrobiopterin dehydratase